VRLQNG